MMETPAEVRAAFGLFDSEGKGYVAADLLQARLLDASSRISARYLKQLLSRVCRVAGDGKRLFFEYKLRLKNLTTEGSRLRAEEKGGKEEEENAGESEDAETKQGEATGQGVTSAPPFA
ncbi:unnamed protein product [Ectocarpus sp. CCAP 1310/34]|nr:unnamed protein product [Ectocarpus sp. CCAP 1310/34]